MATRIMVIDDEPLIGQLLEYQLSGAGFEVAAYQHVQDALLQLARSQPDLILLDVMMPEISGWDLCRQIRASSNIPIIMLTAKDGDDDVVRGLTGGADDYVGKPFSQTQLVARIEAVLRRSQSTPARHRKATTPAPVEAHSAALARPVGDLPSSAPPSPAAAEPDLPLAPEAAEPVVALPAPANASAPVPPGSVAVSSTTKLPRLGQRFAEARQRSGLSLHDAGRASGVRWEFLQAIEQEEFNYVPRTDLRHALRAYSTLLDVDLKPYTTRASRAARRARPAPLHLTIVMAALLAIVIVLVALVM
jgi:CheY-like chemotaxis protein